MDNLSPASVVTDRAFVGFASTGTPITRIRLGSQSPIATRGILSTWRENLRYNWDISYGMGRFYNVNLPRINGRVGNVEKSGNIRTNCSRDIVVSIASTDTNTRLGFTKTCSINTTNLHHYVVLQP